MVHQRLNARRVEISLESRSASGAYDEQMINVTGIELGQDPDARPRQKAPVGRNQRSAARVSIGEERQTRP
jgi:hypothetical protein